MRLFTTFILLTTLALSANAQSSTFIPSSDAYWSINDTEMSWSYPMRPYGTGGDTLISGLTYTKIYQSATSEWSLEGADYVCAGRVEQGEWLFIPSGETTEYKLYDFDVAIGDLVELNNPWSQGEAVVQVMDIDTVTILGQVRRRVHVDEASFGGFGEVWIEGIGSTAGLLFTGYHYFDVGRVLMCFHEDEILSYLNSPNGQCDFTNVGLDEHSIAASWSLFPNPTESVMTITAEQDIGMPARLNVYDATARLVMTQEWRNMDASLEIRGLPSGVYLIELELESGLKSSKRLLVLER